MALKNRILTSTAWIIFILAPYSLFAQNIAPQQVRVNGGVVIPQRNMVNWLANNKTNGTVQVLLHLRNIPSATERKALQASGVSIQDYIDGNSYTAVITPAKLSAIPDIIVGATDIPASWKMDTDVKKEATKGKGDAALIVSFYDVVNDKEIKQLLQSLEANSKEGALESIGIYKLTIANKDIEKLASHYAVKYISLQAENHTLNFVSRTASKANIGSLATMYGGYGLTGKGVTVGVGDNVSGNFHIDLKDRITNYNPNGYTDHGVHINGIVGGAGIMDIEGEGVASGATLIDHTYNLIWEQTPILYPLHNMTITNNSYAAVIQNCNYSGIYNVYSEAIDKLALQYKDVLHVFASGNDGMLNCTPYPQGFGTVTGGYQPSKNNIVVTSTNKGYINALDASRGPVKDGRLKPEITAVGVDVNSTTRSEEYLVAGGTSMASPGVAGALALLTERYKQLNGPANPRADVLKTLLLNGATDMDNPGPDYRFGFGFMNLYRSLLMLDNNRFVTNTVSNAAQQTININVPAKTAQLKVMLCWHDAASNPMATTQLVNDLDIEVTTPTGTIHKPLVLDATPANILLNATEKEDRLNNCEQVVVYEPQAGNYTVTVKGFKVPTGAQDFVVAYDIITDSVHITYPTAGAQVKAGDTVRVYWDASDDKNSFKLEYTVDGGSVWNVINNDIPRSDRTYLWEMPAGINSGKCMMRLSANTTALQYTTGMFTTNTQPELALDATQCPGYIKVNWNAIPNAATYEVMKKEGPHMQTVGFTAGTTYTFSGLWPDSTYYIAIRPVIDGIGGYRSLALKRKPNDGNCAGSISDGDLMVQRIDLPSSGRKFTSTELKSTDTILVTLRNLDDVAANNYRLWYSINGAAWASVNGTTPIPAIGTITLGIGGTDFTAIGNYDIKVAVQNIGALDTEHKNDSAAKTIKQLANAPVSLTSAALYDFENWPVLQAFNDSMGISPDDRWDYSNISDTCRIRSFVKSDVTINGNRSISMDAVYNSNRSHKNELTGTFNLAAYNAQNEEVRMEFKYILHSRPRNDDSNMVYVKGNDLQPLKALYSFRNAVVREKTSSGSVSVTDALLAAGQNFSTSTQLVFTQNDASLISTDEYGTGLTIDDVTLYTVQNDMQLLSVVSPEYIECGLAALVPLTVKVRNGVNQVQNNVLLNYKLDNGTVVSEVLGTIAGKQTIDYTFNQKMDMSATGTHVVSVWIVATGDSYVKNDSINNYVFHNQPLVTSYPYKETFEVNNGNWFTDGVNSSWAWGKPASPRINKAASGEKAWKTNLTGNYNPSEQSYLYSPCFDIASLGNPVYRFRTAMDIEYCGGILCDGAAIQYSKDGKSWERLGEAGEGTGWYNDTLYNIWSIQDATDWRVASIALPKGLQTVRFRYIFASDQGSELEGMAIDDVEIFDDIPVPAEDALINVSPNPTNSGNITIEWSTKGGSDLELVMYNAMGKEVYRATDKGMAGGNKTMIQTPRFASGVYIMRVIIGDKKFSKKIVYL